MFHRSDFKIRKSFREFAASGAPAKISLTFKQYAILT